MLSPVMGTLRSRTNPVVVCGPELGCSVTRLQNVKQPGCCCASSCTKVSSVAKKIRSIWCGAQFARPLQITVILARLTHAARHSCLCTSLVPSFLEGHYQRCATHYWRGEFQIEDKKRRKAAEKAAQLAAEAREDARLARDVQELAGLSGGPPFAKKVSFHLATELQHPFEV